MDTTTLRFKEFLKLPAAKQVVAGAVIIISGVTSGLLFMVKENRELWNDKVQAEMRATTAEKRCGDEKIALIQDHAREMREFEAAKNAEAEARWLHDLSERENAAATIENRNKATLYNQARTLKNLKK